MRHGPVSNSVELPNSCGSSEAGNAGALAEVLTQHVAQSLGALVWWKCTKINSVARGNFFHGCDLWVIGSAHP